ncbi:MAG: efflux RND transporter periplasmic adaptor subunit [Planctomycetaceae bacterium]|jgi:Cu(I)/Ag(I) efflux system membrane fusion protein|nr:efflux RND transporter periplasmic adaptor subunit [Planctomycetaceae bacterium]
MPQKYRSFIPFILIVLLSGAAGWGIAKHTLMPATDGDTAALSGERKILYYQCPMHPSVMSKNAVDKCTICGMALGPIYDNAGGEDTQQAFGALKLSPAVASVIGIKTSEVRTAVIHRTLRVAGVIVDDETRHRILSARVPGRIEKLYINQVGIEVVHNQPLAEIYSPDVLTAQRIYLENLRAGSRGAVSLSEIADSREKLLAYGLVAQDIQKVEETQKPDTMFTLRAPFDGTVISRNVFEGQYVNVNDNLFEIGDFSTLWFIFDAYEQDLPLLRLNQSVDVTLNSLPNETVSAPITFIDPNLNETTRTARVRVVLPNPQRRILNRQTANGVVHIESAPVLSVPRSAVIYTHQKPAAYVDLGGGTYQIRKLTLGIIGDEDAEVLSGVQDGENAVTKAALLIDSQSQLAHVGAPESDEKTEKTHRNETTVLPGSIANPVLPASFLEIMLAATAALSSDDLAAYQKHLPVLLENVQKLPEDMKAVLIPLAEKLIAGADLKDARRYFEPFSNTAADIVRAQPAEERQAKIFQCPMSPVLGTARWIQKDNAEVLNPFFGSEMLNCGTELQ